LVFGKLDFLGMDPDENLIPIQVDQQGRMDVNHLQDTLNSLLEEGMIPFMVAATIGTTVLGWN